MGMTQSTFAEILTKTINNFKTKNDESNQNSTLHSYEPPANPLFLHDLVSLKQRTNPSYVSRSYKTHSRPNKTFDVSSMNAKQKEKPSEVTACTAATPHPLTEPQKQIVKKWSELGECLKDNFAKDELKKAFRRLAIATHPDHGGKTDLFIEIKKDYEILHKVFDI